MGDGLGVTELGVSGTGSHPRGVAAPLVGFACSCWLSLHPCYPLMCVAGVRRVRGRAVAGGGGCTALALPWGSHPDGMGQGDGSETPSLPLPHPGLSLSPRGGVGTYWHTDRQLPLPVLAHGIAKTSDPCTYLH